MIRREVLLFHKDYTVVDEYFSQKDMIERGVFLLSKICSNSGFIRFIGNKLIIPEDSDYLERTHFRIAFKPKLIRRIFEQCIEEQFHLVDFHCHPFSSKGTTFSPVDDAFHLGVIAPYIDRYVKNLMWASIVEVWNG